MAAPEEEELDPRALLRELSVISGAAALVAAAIGWAAGQPLFARSILLGASVGVLNFMLLARGISAAFARTRAGTLRVEQQRDLREDAGVEPVEVVDRAYDVGSRFRSLLVISLVLVLLWFLEADPVGVAAGVILVLAVASLSAARHHRITR